MTLKPLPAQVLAAAQIRRQAAELILVAEQLEAEVYEYKPKRQHDWKAELKRIKEK